MFNSYISLPEGTCSGFPKNPKHIEVCVFRILSDWWFGTWMDYFSIQLGIITIPTDELIWLSEGRWLNHQTVTDDGSSVISRPNSCARWLINPMNTCFFCVCSSINPKQGKRFCASTFREKSRFHGGPQSTHWDFIGDFIVIVHLSL